MNSPRTVAIVGSAHSGVHDVFAALCGHTTESPTVTAQPWRYAQGTHGDHALTFLSCDDPETTTTQWPQFIYAMDAVVFVVSAQQGMDSGLIDAWDATIRYRIPRLIVVTHLDDGRADIDEIAAIARRVFDDSDSIHVVVQPAMNDAENYAGTIDLINLTVTDVSQEPIHTRPCDPEHIAFIDSQRQEVIGFLASHSDESNFFDQVLAGVMPTTDRISKAAHECMSRGLLTPVLPFSHSPYEFGVREVITYVTDHHLHHAHLPIIVSSDPDHPYDSERDFCAQVIVHASEKSFIKVWTGDNSVGWSSPATYAIDQPLTVGSVLPQDRYAITLPEV
jgi:hypothetical protein